MRVAHRQEWLLRVAGLLVAVGVGPGRVRGRHQPRARALRSDQARDCRWQIRAWRAASPKTTPQCDAAQGQGRLIGLRRRAVVARSRRRNDAQVLQDAESLRAGWSAIHHDRSQNLLSYFLSLLNRPQL
jgi:hypothetical protein